MQKSPFSFSLPCSLINRFSLPILNFAYYHLQKRCLGRKISHYEPFLYPLDNCPQLYRLYGPKGFYQYQCVFPQSTAQDAVAQMLRAIRLSKSGSFLTVLKSFGAQASLGMLSFPEPGVTLAIDFPNQGRKTLKLFEQLDSILKEAGGRIYLAKDARMSRPLFEATYPKLNEFKKYRDPGISSGLSRRLMEY